MLVFYGVGFLSVVGLVKYRSYMSTKLIDPKNNLKRNYSKIFIGIKDKEVADENTLDLRGYYRNIYVDSLLIQRYYSFLGSNGTIVLFSGREKRYINDNWICPLDYPLLHPVTLMENHIKPPKYLIYNPLIGLLFIWMTLFGSKREGLYSLDIKTTGIKEFCKLRNVNIEII